MDKFNCETCGSKFFEKRNLKQHVREHHLDSGKQDGNCNFVQRNMKIIELDGQFALLMVSSALRGYARTYQIQSTATWSDTSAYLQHCNNLISTLIGMMLSEWNHGMKILTSLHVKFVRSSDTSETITAHFNSSQRIILQSSEVISEIKFGQNQISDRIDKFTEKGSGWIVDSISHLDVHIAKYQVMRGSTYKELPAFLKSKKAIINVQNKDHKCFMWSVLAALFPVKVHQHPYRVSKYISKISVFNFDCIAYPVPLKDIKKFETANDISVNVFGLDGRDIYPLHISECDSKLKCDLLLHDGHYSCIRSLDRLLFDQNNKKVKKYFCRRCLSHEYSEAALAVHNEHCMKNEPCRVKLPTHKTLCFNNIHRQQRVPMTIYADFECILQNTADDTNQANSADSYTKRIQKHIPSGYGFVLMQNCGCEGVLPKIHQPSIYQGSDSVKRFLHELFQLCDQQSQERKCASMSSFDWHHYQKAKTCHVCKQDIRSEDTKGARVVDHCHICGKYRGAAHSKCNLGYRLVNEIPVIFHNLRRYDSHLIMSEIACISKEHDLEIDCVPKGLDDYLCFTVTKMDTFRKRKFDHSSEGSTQTDQKRKRIWKLKFIDSIQFLPSSLDSLVAALNEKGKHNFKSMEQHMTANKDLLLRKGVYPYEYMDKFDKFNETKLPVIEQFYSRLHEEGISQQDYDFAQTVWRTMKCESLSDYQNVYLKTDILLLCDVFENFRNFCLEHFGLDPCHYITLPSFGWDACLKQTGVELELIHDVNVYNFFEKGIRGGLSMISHRYAKANNPYMKDYNPQESNTYILYLDANNLYGYSMIQKLPVGGFRWLKQYEIDSIEWESVNSDGDVGWTLEVDMDYPSHLHLDHNDYPLAPDHMNITDDMLSPYASNLKLTKIRSPTVTTKLVANLLPKRNYVIHIKTLQLYMSLGLRLSKIHRVIQFDQKAWMKDYIDFNTKQRQMAASICDKDMFKLLNNAVFGKTMENVREYVDVKLAVNESCLLKWAGNPRFKQFSIFNDGLVALMLKKSTVCLNKPIYTGFSVLELSKHLMYSFHYFHIKKIYGNNVQLLFTDTDSLCYAVKTTDVYKDMKDHIDYFDTSEYPTDHFIYSQENKKVLGKMKDELNGVPITEFVGLRSKMYSLTTEATEKKRAKGVKKSVLKKMIRHSDYKKVLFEHIEMKHLMTMIRSYDHNLFTILQNKRTLSAFDDKRYLLTDGIRSLAYGNLEIDQKNK